MMQGEESGAVDGVGVSMAALAILDAAGAPSMASTAAIHWRGSIGRVVESPGLLNPLGWLGRP